MSDPAPRGPQEPPESLPGAVPDSPPEGVVELRALYARLQPPPLSDDLADADVETARVVGWMRDTWRQLEPAAVVPRSIALPRRFSRSARRALAAAAAAVLLAVAGTAVLRALARRPAPARLGQVAQGSARAAASDVEILVVRPDQIELRSGPVRLVLLEPPAPQSNEPGR